MHLGFGFISKIKPQRFGKSVANKKTYILLTKIV